MGGYRRIVVKESVLSTLGIHRVDIVQKNLIFYVGLNENIGYMAHKGDFGWREACLDCFINGVLAL